MVAGDASRPRAPGRRFCRALGQRPIRAPEPRAHVLRGIARHDDGWAARDAAPQITRQGKPSAFSVELVGKYSAFEEIDLADYLAVRDRAVRLIAAEDPYAAMLISMHTYSLLSEHADRSTIAPDQLPLLDQFLEQQKAFQQSLLQAGSRPIRALPPEQKKRRGDLRSFPAAAGERQSFSAHLRGLFRAGAPAAPAAAARRRPFARRSALGGRAPLRSRSLPV